MAKNRRRAYRDRITFQAPIKSESPYGQQKIVSHANISGLVGLHADFTHTGGTETFRGRQVQPTVIGVFEIRNPRMTIDPAWRVIHHNDCDKAYEIVSARPAEDQFEGGNRRIWVFVKAIA